MLDAAICQLVRGMSQVEREELLPRLVSGEEARVIEAVLRAPGILSAMSDSMRSSIETAAIRRQHPEAVMLQESLEEAAGLTQHVLREAVALVIESSGLGELEALGALGDDWRGLVKPLGGSDEITDSLAKRYAPQEAS